MHAFPCKEISPSRSSSLVKGTGFSLQGIICPIYICWVGSCSVVAYHTASQPCSVVAQSSYLVAAYLVIAKLDSVASSTGYHRTLEDKLNESINGSFAM